MLEAPSTPGPWEWNVGAYESFALNPVTVRNPSGGVAFRPLADVLETDLVGEVGLGDRAAIGLSLPFALYQNGTTPLPSSVATTGGVPESALGDLAIHGKAAIIPIPEDKLAGFGLAVLGALTLPTGDPGSFMGEGSSTVSARALVEYKYLVARVQASIGYRLRTDHHAWPDAGVGGVEIGDDIPWSFAIGLKAGVISHVIDEDDRQRFELGVHGSLPAGPVGPFGLGDPGGGRLSPVLLALSDRVEIGHYKDVYALGGVEFGLTDAIGVPSVRFVASIGWAPREHDEDHDGVPDDRDQCTPDMPEDRDHIQDEDGCPEDDADEDGVPDEKDACPLVAGEASSDPKTNGCPAAVQKKESGTMRPPFAPFTIGNRMPAVVTDDAEPKVSLRTPLTFDASGALDGPSLEELRALAVAMAAHPTWSIGVGARPAGDDDAARQAALARAGVVVRALNDLLHRDNGAEVVTWDAAQAAAGTAGGAGGDVGLLVLLPKPKEGSP